MPENFDIAKYFGNAWAVYRGSEAYEIAIRFLPDAARLVIETNWHHTQVVQKLSDGSVVLSFNVDGLNEISNWLLSWTGSFEVLRPSELKNVVIKRLRKGLSLNDQ